MASKEYLKKYISAGDTTAMKLGITSMDKKEKKKKKRKDGAAVKGGNVTIKEDDDAWYDNKKVEEDDEIEEYAPQIVAAENTRIRVEEYQPVAKSTGQWQNIAGGDESPPRRRHDSDGEGSPPRRRHDSDMEDNEPPPQVKPTAKAAAARPTAAPARPRDSSPPRRGGGDRDSSPPRRGGGARDSSPPRRGGGDRDSSPPRRGGGGARDSSPPRRGGARDSSPPRRGGGGDRDSSPPRKRAHSPARGDRDNSPPRRGGDRDRDRDRDSSPPRKKARIEDEPLAAIKSGLTTGKDFKQVALRKKLEDEKRLATMSKEESGQGQETVYRDKHGRKLTMLNEMVRLEKGGKKKDDEEQLEWGSGLVQKREAEARAEEMAREAAKPFARYADDEDLEASRKEELRWDDPMRKHVSTTKKKSKGPEKPKYKGVAPPNRFNILPGFRWDGVDRSNGFESKLASAKNAAANKTYTAYRDLMEDM